MIQWAYRLLYVLLFLGLIVPMGYLANPTTLPFLGALFCFLLPILFSQDVLFLDDYDPLIFFLHSETRDLCT